MSQASEDGKALPRLVAASTGLAGIGASWASRDTVGAISVAHTDLRFPYVDGRKVAGAVIPTSPPTPVLLRRLARRCSIAQEIA